MMKEEFTLAGRAGWLAAIVGLSLTALIASSVVFAQGDQATRIIRHGRVVAAAEEVLTATTGARGAAAIALVVADARNRGLASDDQVTAALEDFGAALGQTTSRVDRVGELLTPADADGLARRHEALSVAAASLTALIEGDAVAQANEWAAETLLPAFGELEAFVESERASGFGAMVAEEGTGGRMARFGSISVALLVPGMALAVYLGRQRRRERQLRLEMQLRRRTEEVAVKNRMIANLSHQLRTPLTGIYGGALAMRDEGFNDAAFQREMTDLIVGESADLARMVEDLLATARLDAGELVCLSEPVDVGVEIGGVLSGFPETVQPSPVDCESAVVLADGDRVRHVLRNLLSNAFRHGGEHVALVGTRQAGTYRIDVVDDGPGLPAGVEDRVFDRFTHDGDAPLVVGTLGLGLSVARELVERMGGTITHRRHDDLTVFSVELPVAEGSEDANHVPAGREAAFAES